MGCECFHHCANTAHPYTSRWVLSFFCHVYPRNCLAPHSTWTEMKTVLVVKKRTVYTGRLVVSWWVTYLNELNMQYFLICCSMTVNAPYLELWPELFDLPSPERTTPPSKLDNLSTNFSCFSFHILMTFFSVFTIRLVAETLYLQDFRHSQAFGDHTTWVQVPFSRKVGFSKPSQNWSLDIFDWWG